jgi:CDP-glucose 4,6-dehydratase
MVPAGLPDESFWRGKRVLLTGHTGFKGSWLSLWLQIMGAEVHGYALPPTSLSVHEVARIGSRMASSTLADIRDLPTLVAVIARVQPEIVFHLAAQALVRSSYAQPVDTYSVNVMGAVHVLEAVRAAGRVRAVVHVTSDKCYENREWTWGYRENEPMGGHDPYSSSKGCAELVTSAYRRSFFAAGHTAVATARSGNVIGGGDWSADRLLPDLLRAVDSGTPLAIRSPMAVRPWQHALEPLSGYLTLAERLFCEGNSFAEAWNFGPCDEDAQSVLWIVQRVTARYPELSWVVDASPQPHEAGYLKLDSSKARTRLKWAPRWRLESAIDKSLDWHAAWRSGLDMREVTLDQINQYLGARAEAGCGAT